MRALFVLALLVLPIAATPAALAAASQLSINAPEGPIAGDATIPVTIHLVVSDFMCSDARQFTVALSTSTTDGVKALFDVSNLTFDVPPHSYYVDQYDVQSTVNLTVRALRDGQVTMNAHFEADVGPCFVPGGFDPADASLTRDVTASTASTTPPPEPTPPTSTTTDTTNQTTPPPTNETQPTPSPSPPPSPSPSSSTVGCAPDKSCGAIGEYQPAPSESSSGDSKATPAAPIALGLACIAALALTMRRRSR